MQRSQKRLREMEILVSDEIAGMFPLPLGKVQTFAMDVIESSGIGEYSINIVCIGNERMAELNEKYKHRSGATDVLSFNISEDSSDIVEGEIYVSLESAKTQSSEFAVSYNEEIIRLITHGLLHLAGRTHASDDDYQSMMKDTNTFVDKFFQNKEMS